VIDPADTRRVLAWPVGQPERADPGDEVRRVPHVARRIADIRASDEGREGVQSFLGKRAPAWLPRED
jgi:hypothetical protein